MYEALGVYGFAHICTAACQAIPQDPPFIHQVVTIWTLYSLCPYRLWLHKVAGQIYSCLWGCSFCPSSAFIDTDDRWVCSGLRGSPGLQPNSKFVVLKGSHSSYKCQRSKDCSPCLFRPSSSYQGEKPVLIDSTVMLFYLNIQGRTCSSLLWQEAIHLWNFCFANSVSLKDSYLPGCRTSCQTT